MGTLAEEDASTDIPDSSCLHVTYRLSKLCYVTFCGRKIGELSMVTSQRIGGTVRNTTG